MIVICGRPCAVGNRHRTRWPTTVQVPYGMPPITPVATFDTTTPVGTTKSTTTSLTVPVPSPSIVPVHGIVAPGLTVDGFAIESVRSMRGVTCVRMTTVLSVATLSVHVQVNPPAIVGDRPPGSATDIVTTALAPGASAPRSHIVGWAHGPAAVL